MTGQDGGFSQAARRFIAEVDTALTRARRAAREARAVSEEFRRRTGELGAAARTGKLRGLRRGEVKPTTEESRAQAVEFRTANGYPVDEPPPADVPVTGRPAGSPVTPEHEDFSQHRVLFDIDAPDEPEAAENQERNGDRDGGGEDGGKRGGIDSPQAGSGPSRDDDDDFSQQRILLDATVESYRPDDMPGLVFDPDEPKNTRSDVSSERRSDKAD